MENGCKASGLMIAPKVFTIIHGMELGKSVALPNIMGRSFVRSDNSAGGRGEDKKLKPVKAVKVNVLIYDEDEAWSSPRFNQTKSTDTNGIVKFGYSEAYPDGPSNLNNPNWKNGPKILKVWIKNKNGYRRTWRKDSKWTETELGVYRGFFFSKDQAEKVSTKAFHRPLAHPHFHNPFQFSSFPILTASSPFAAQPDTIQTTHLHNYLLKAV